MSVAPFEDPFEDFELDMDGGCISGFCRPHSPASLPMENVRRFPSGQYMTLAEHEWAQLYLLSSRA